MSFKNLITEAKEWWNRPKWEFGEDPDCASTDQDQHEFEFEETSCSDGESSQCVANGSGDPVMTPILSSLPTPNEKLDSKFRENDANGHVNRAKDFGLDSMRRSMSLPILPSKNRNVSKELPDLVGNDSCPMMAAPKENLRNEGDKGFDSLRTFLSGSPLPPSKNVISDESRHIKTASPTSQRPKGVPTDDGKGSDSMTRFLPNSPHVNSNVSWKTPESEGLVDGDNGPIMAASPPSLPPNEHECDKETNNEHAICNQDYSLDNVETSSDPSTSLTSPMLLTPIKSPESRQSSNRVNQRQRKKNQSSLEGTPRRSKRLLDKFTN